MKPAHTTPPTARFIAANPCHYADRPGLFAIAWDILKTARGQAIDRTRIGTPRHLVEAQGEPHLRTRIHARANEIGKTGPAPLICDGAKV